MTAMSYDREHGCPAPPAAAGADGRGDAGLLHDLGHQMMTVSLLAESLSADNELSEESRRRSELLVQETARALGMIADGMPCGPAPQEDETQLIDIRQLAGQLARLARLAHPAAITLLPGSPAYVQVNPMQVWRVLWNLIDNAARAAGPDGHVEIAIRRGDGTVIEVTDDGPGYGLSYSWRGWPRPLGGPPASRVVRRPAQYQHRAGRRHPGECRLRRPVRPHPAAADAPDSGAPA